MSDLLAAFLAAQFDGADQIRAERRRVSTTYRRLLEPLAASRGLELPYQPDGDEPADHMFYVLLPDAAARPAIIASMRDEGVLATFHYVPLHSAPAAATLADGHPDCPVTDDVSRRILRLPFYNDLSDDDIARVVDTFIRAFDLALADTQHR